MAQKINTTKFKEELKALLDKYGAMIYWSCGENSDTYGIYDSHLEVSFKDSNKRLRGDNGYITSNNIKDYKTK